MRSAVLKIAMVVLGLARASFASDTTPFAVYVGTYTDTTSKGIYRFTFDPASGVAGVTCRSYGCVCSVFDQKPSEIQGVAPKRREQRDLAGRIPYLNPRATPIHVGSRLNQ